MEESTVLAAGSAGSPRPASPLAVRELARHRTVAWQSSARPSGVDRIGVPPSGLIAIQEQGAWGRGREEEAGR